MRLLVTGGAGFIGSHIVDVALAQGHTVAALDNLSTGRRENVASGATLYEVDLRDADATRRAVQDFRPDVVSHQAAQASVVVSVRDPRLDVEINVMGGMNLLEACRATDTRKLVFASTGGAIYGEVPESTRAQETDPARPASTYAISKFAFEQLMGVYVKHHGFSVTVLRYANVYGERQDPHGEAGVVAIFGARARKGESLSIFAKKATGDGGCIRDYVHVSDVARANLLAAEGKLGENVRMMNVCTGVGITTRALAEQIVALTGSRSALVEAEPRIGDLERSVLEPRLCRQVLGEPMPLDVGLSRALNWMQQQPQSGGAR